MTRYPGFDERGAFEYDDETDEYIYDENKEVLSELKSEKVGMLNIGLGGDNFLMKYIKYASELTDAYPEYHYATGLSILSIISNRQLVCRFTIDTIYPNLWMWCLGISTYSKKTTAMNRGEIFLENINVNRLMEYYTPEALIEFLSNFPRSYLWIDEAGQMLSSFEKDYMAEIKDMMCRLYDNRGFSRMTRTSVRKSKKTFCKVIEPYVTQLLMTTPDIFKSKTKRLDITSGWLLRYLYFVPEYTKSWKGIRNLNETDNIRETEIKDLINKKIKLLQSINGEVNVHFDKTALDYWNDWQKKPYEELGKTQDEYVGAILGRYQIYALKLATLFEFGEKNYVVGNKISIKNMIEACRQMDEYFIPVARKLVEDIGTNEEKNLIDKILGTLKRSGGKIYHSRLLQLVKINTRYIDESLETMEEAGMIKWDKKSNMIQKTG